MTFSITSTRDTEYMVVNQAIVIPETIDAIRALAGTVRAANESIVRTNTALGIDSALM